MDKPDSAAPRQPEGPSPGDLTNEELSLPAYAVVPDLTRRLVAEVKRRRAQPAAAAPLVALRREARSALDALASAREMLGIFEDHGGHDGLNGEGYRATLDQIDDTATSLRAALAAAPRDERPDELRLALEASERVGNYKEAHAMLVRAVRSRLAAAAPIGAPDARRDGFQRAGLAQIRLALETAAQVGEIYFQSNALAKGAGERITAALVQLAFLEKQSPPAAAASGICSFCASNDHFNCAKYRDPPRTCACHCNGVF